MSDLYKLHRSLSLPGAVAQNEIYFVAGAPGECAMYVVGNTTRQVIGGAGGGGGSASWGGISGVLSAQADLASALAGKQPIATVLTNTTASYTTAEQAKLAAIAAGATANSSDATLLARASHTGTQLAATISDFSTAVAAAAAVTANTAKVTNATHTGDVTGATALTIAAGVVSNAKLATVAANTIKGNNTAGVASPVDMTVAQTKALLAYTAADVGAAASAHTHAASGVTDFSAAADARIGAASINALSDVIITAATTGQVIKFNGANWVNDVDATGGGGIADGDKGDITVSAAGATWTIDAGVVTLAKMADITTATLIGRTTAGTGVPEALTPAQGRTVLGLGTLATQSGTFSGTSSGTNTGDQTITLTGDITGSGTGSFVTAITTNAVVLSDLAQVATSTFLGRITAATGNVESLTVAQTKTVLAYTSADIGAATAAQANATHTGDATGATALTLATVNANIGSWGLAGSIAQFTVNAKGLVTAAANVAISIASTAISDSTAAGRAFLTATTAAAQTALLDVFTSGAKGLAPASGGGTTNFLRADGTWAAAGGGSPVTVQDEGVDITTALGTLNFVGAGVTVTGGATATVTIPGGGGVTDGDKGDITVSGGGTVWTVNPAEQFGVAIAVQNNVFLY